MLSDHPSGHSNDSKADHHSVDTNYAAGLDCVRDGFDCVDPMSTRPCPNEKTRVEITTFSLIGP